MNLMFMQFTNCRQDRLQIFIQLVNIFIKTYKYDTGLGVLGRRGCTGFVSGFRGVRGLKLPWHRGYTIRRCQDAYGSGGSGTRVVGGV